MSTMIVTGGHGFLGWHLRCRLRAAGIETTPVGRDLAQMGEALAETGDVPVIFHLAGVNRAATELEVEEGNLAIALELAGAIGRAARPVHVVNANSVHQGTDSAYGRGKRGAVELLRKVVADVGGTLQDVRLPNLFGEHGRPRYNSFVATFADAVARGESPTVTGDREVPLLHAQSAAGALVGAADERRDGESEPAGEPRLISEVLGDLRVMHRMYADAGELPDLSTEWMTDLFNTYRSFLEIGWQVHPQTFDDQRGRLFETVRMNGGVGQAYVSSTNPGQTRGEHWHLRKFERFVVVAGSAEIKLRRLFTDEVITVQMDGERPGYVDMPTMWAHNISNVGDRELVTMFWSDQLLDRDNPDQFSERVEVAP